jgi:hypothetical protein
MSFELSPVDPAALEWAETWYPVAWKGLLTAGAITALAAFATIAFLLLLKLTRFRGHPTI